MKIGGQYNAAIDGLRLLAFALVFAHHLPLPAGAHDWWVAFYPKGWLGVDLFFAISSFLLFRSLHSEFERNGRVSVGGFFIRRIARVYPLLILFALTVTLTKSTGSFQEYSMLAGYILGIGNFMWVVGLTQFELPILGHLWSLSFELQLYLAVPALFIMGQCLKTKRFLLLLGGVFLYAQLGRQLMFSLEARHPIVYMTPLLRPESFLAGIALASIAPRWPVVLSVITAGVSAAGLVLLQQPWLDQTSSLLTYPLVGVFSASAIDAACRGGPIRAALAWRPISFLGECSYGLYIFHLIIVVEGFRIVSDWQRGEAIGGLVWWATMLAALALTVVCAALSYKLIEIPIYKWARQRLAPG